MIFFLLLQIFHCLIGSDTDGWLTAGCRRPSLLKVGAPSTPLSLQFVILSHHLLLRWGQGVALAPCLLFQSQNKSKSANPEAPPRASQATLSEILMVRFKLDPGELGNEQSDGPWPQMALGRYESRSPARPWEAVFWDPAPTPAYLSVPTVPGQLCVCVCFGPQLQS